MLQCRLGLPCRPNPLALPTRPSSLSLSFALSCSLVRSLVLSFVHSLLLPSFLGREEKRWDVNCFQSRAKLERKCSTRATLACVHARERELCTRVCACERRSERRQRDEGRKGVGKGVGGRVCARMFLDSVAPRYYVRPRTKGRGGGRGGKFIISVIPERECYRARYN